MYLGNAICEERTSCNECINNSLCGWCVDQVSGIFLTMKYALVSKCIEELKLHINIMCIQSRQDTRCRESFTDCDKVYNPTSEVNNAQVEVHVI